MTWSLSQSLGRYFEGSGQNAGSGEQGAGRDELKEQGFAFPSFSQEGKIICHLHVFHFQLEAFMSDTTKEGSLGSGSISAFTLCVISGK